MADKPVRALVLSGGGGRGAYQVGVYEHLTRCGWKPDIVVGTSIGAVNGAAIAGGFAPDQLRDLWQAMITENVQTLSNDLPAFERMALRVLLKEVLTSEPNGEFEPDISIHVDAQIDRVGWAAGTAVRGFFGRGNLLDNQRWEKLLQVSLPWHGLNAPDAPRMGAVTTDVHTGAMRVFWNHTPGHGRTHLHAEHGLSTKHIMASCSIPGLYPSLALVEIDGRPYWDGAVVSNTPLGAALDAGATEAIVVMMTPWYDACDDCLDLPEPRQPTLGETLNRVLDWALLAPFRADLRAWRQLGLAEPLIIAPDTLMPLTRIIDYEPATHEALFVQGRADAERVLPVS